MLNTYIREAAKQRLRPLLLREVAAPLRKDKEAGTSGGHCGKD